MPATASNDAFDCLDDGSGVQPGEGADLAERIVRAGGGTFVEYSQGEPNFWMGLNTSPAAQRQWDARQLLRRLSRLPDSDAEERARRLLEEATDPEVDSEAWHSEYFELSLLEFHLLLLVRHRRVEERRARALAHRKAPPVAPPPTRYAAPRRVSPSRGDPDGGGDGEGECPSNQLQLWCSRRREAYRPPRGATEPEILPAWVEEQAHLPLKATAALDAIAARLEPPDSDGLDPDVLPEAPFGLWRFRVLHARNLERHGELIEHGLDADVTTHNEWECAA